MGYKYWEEKEKVIDDKGEEGYIIGFIEIDNIEAEKEKVKQNVDKVSKNYEKINKEYKEATDNNKLTTQLSRKYIDAGEELRKAKDSQAKFKSRCDVLVMNGDMTIKIERLKDMYSRKENVAITILRGKDNDGRIVSTIKNLSDSIHELDDYGVYLNAVYYDELKKIIQEVYYKLKAQDKEFVDNNVPERVVTDFFNICKENIKKEKIKPDTKNKNHYYVPVTMFKEWYEDSAYRRYKIADIKEALIFHEFCNHNTGRNDYTTSENKKVICFYADKVEV